MLIEREVPLQLLRTVGMMKFTPTSTYPHWLASHFSSLLMAVLFSSVSPTSVWAQQPGDLDSTFGMDGRVFTEIAVPLHDVFYPTTESMLVQPDGKILVGGRFWEDGAAYSFGTFIVRYMPDGILDTSFGDNGRVAFIPPFIPPGYPNGGQAVGADMALQPDGKIVLIGHGTVADTIMVQRYTTSGQLDTTFGDSGTTFVNGNEFEEGTSIAIQPDGKIVGGGWDYEPYVTPYYDAIILFRLNANGSPDTSFGLGGTGKVFIEDGYDGAEVLVQPDAKILVVGTLLNFTDVPETILLARYNVDGSLDAGFGTDGMVTHRVNNLDSVARAAALQTDGKIVVVGSLYPSDLTAALQTDGKSMAAGKSNPLTVVVRYNPDGSLDTGFGTSGVATLSMNFVVHPNTVLLQSNGKIVVTGADDFTVVRLNSDGTLDTGFGSGGRSVFPINAGDTNDADASVGALQPDGKILVAGSFGHYYTDSHEKIALIRVSGDPGAAAPINAGLNDAWVSEGAPFQGMFVTVFPGLKLVFVAWFTFDSVIPNSGTATFGAIDQRWVTAVGPFSGGKATLKAELTTGGAFNTDSPLPTQDTNYGTIVIEFENCSEGTVTYNFPGVGISGSFPIKRVVNSNVALCEALQTG
jgi:uncharacterized delta-60 repeat protein